MSLANFDQCLTMNCSRMYYSFKYLNSYGYLCKYLTMLNNLCMCFRYSYTINFLHECSFDIQNIQPLYLTVFVLFHMLTLHFHFLKVY